MQHEQLKKLLFAKRDELTLRREKIHTDFFTRHTSKNLEQQNKERENDDVLSMLDHDAQKELAKIKQALKRLDTDNFQQCQSCGEDISDERLLAIPYTAYCRHCANVET